MKTRSVCLGFLLCFALSSATVCAEELPNPDEVLTKADTVLRGDSHEMLISIEVKTKRWERQYTMRVWMEGLDHMFSRVLEPAKMEGQGFLRHKARLWNYLPTAERVILIPPSLMLDRFLGSDFTNDDLVKLTYLPRDYTSEILAIESLEGVETYHLELIPKPDAPVIYGKLEAWSRVSDWAPLQMKFFSEKQVLLRTLHYSDYKMFGDHEAPTVWHMVNHVETDRQTTIRVLEVEYDIDIDPKLFTRENLEKT